MHQERHYRANEKHHEENFCDACSASGQSAKAQDCGNQRDDEKNDGIVKHVGPRFVSLVGQSTGNDTGADRARKAARCRRVAWDVAYEASATVSKV